MKDKLRELAECDAKSVLLKLRKSVGSNASGTGIDQSKHPTEYKEGLYKAYSHCLKMIEDQINILDAEGDGGAVGWMRPSDEGYDSSFRDARTVMACPEGSWAKDGWIPLFPHLSRSGVVSDEDVEAAGQAYFEDQWAILPPRSKAIYRRALRRSLESYERNRK